MLRSVGEQLGYKIIATDGEIGEVDDFLLDDRYWAILYMVVKTGSWLSSRRVLISPYSLGQPDWASRNFPVSLNSKQVEESPEIDLDKPVSRQHQEQLHRHYNWPAYWMPDPYLPPGPGMPVTATKWEEEAEEEEGDPHLRSSSELMGYHIHALDGDIGHVDDFIMEDVDFIIRYMVVDTRNWLPGRKVLVSPLWIDSVSWSNRMVYVDLLREAVKDSPEYDPSAPVNREYEARLYDYYGRPVYWE